MYGPSTVGDFSAGPHMTGPTMSTVSAKGSNHYKF